MASAEEKTLQVLGAPGSGKATLIGNLLFKCGAIDMLQMSNLQQAGVVSYDKVVSHLERDGTALSFRTRKTVVNLSSSDHVDCAIYLVDATSTPVSIPSLMTDPLRRAKSVIVVVNKMDEVEWSKESYANIIKDVFATLEGSGIEVKKVRAIPVSGLHGDNLIERSAKSSWYEGWPYKNEAISSRWALIDAIDEA